MSDLSPPATRVRYAVLAWLCGAAAFAYIPRNSISAAEEAIRLDLRLSKEEMGDAMGAFFLTYALLQVPSGWLVQRWGSRLALAVFSVLGSVSTALFAAAGGFVALYVARLSMGAAQAGLFPACTASMGRWFARTERGTASGTLAAFMSIGGVLGAPLTGVLLAEQVSWQVVFALYTIPSLFWAAWFYHWFRDRPEEHASVNAAERAVIAPSAEAPTEKDGGRTPWLAILTSRAMFFICAQQFFRAAGYIFFATWFATYLKETRGVSTREAGLLNSLPLVGVVVGSAVGGWLSDRLLVRTGSRRVSRQGLAVVSHLACAGLILAAYPIPEAWLAVLVISTASLVGSFGAPCAYAITIDMGGKYTAPVFALMNMAGNVGAWVFPMVVPRLLHLPGGWDVVLFVFAGIYVAAAVCWIPFDANGTIVKEPAPI